MPILLRQLEAYINSISIGGTIVSNAKTAITPYNHNNTLLVWLLGVSA